MTSPSRSTNDLEERYNRVAYPTHPQESARVDQLAVMATLMGMTPRPPGRCRVLELGCGDGGHLIPLALTLAESEFVGVDLAGVPVARGRKDIEALGLTNVSLRQADIREVHEAPGSFDYVIAHGVYSWVPKEVRARLLAVCGELLAPQGVAYVSHTVLPGGHIRRMLREMMFFHLKSLTDPTERVREAKAFFAMLASVPARSAHEAAYRDVAHEQLRMMEARSENDVFHDELAAINEPVYVVQLAEQARGHGLQFLADADFFTMQEAVFSDEVADWLGQVADEDELLKEQYMDFLRCRQFRKTLLCRQELQLDRSFQPNTIARFWARSDAVPGEPDAEGVVPFTSARHGAVSASNPLMIAAMRTLHEAWPAAVAFGPLLEACLAATGEAGVSRFKTGRSLALFLYHSYSAGVVDLTTGPVHTLERPGERPLASPLARLQAARGTILTTLRHEPVAVEDEAGRRMLRLLDGTRTRAEIVEALTAAGVEESSPERVEEKLAELARLGLLLG
ncbi:MAG: methyltransferase regulatory domain-containing protein [Dehalococcoidia bacterium]|nr:methyltransferase regulatory domain-containing protein [Dehalococcoidia bacterium]